MRYVLTVLTLALAVPATAAPADAPTVKAAVPAAADSQPGTTVIATIASDKEDMGDAGRIICRKIEVTGSRMNSKRVCATATEWAAQKAQNRQVIEQAQNKKWSAEN